MEGLLYLQKYGIGGPEFVTEKERHLFHARAINREACCLQLGQLTGANWNHTLVSGFTRERKLLHPTTSLRPSANELLTELKHSHLFNFKIYKDNFTNSLTKVERRFKKNRGIGNPMYFNRRAFLHTSPSSFKCLSRTQQNA